MRAVVLALIITTGFATNAFASENGIISKPSKYSVPETIDRLSTVLKAKGITIFARIDHAADAERSGLAMRPTQLLIFGNPKAGTPLMNAAPSSAIDLPMKALAWQDENGKVWLSYNSPAYFMQRHQIKDEMMKFLAPIEGLINQAME